MRYYKKTENGCIVMIGTGAGGVEISADEYVQIHETMFAKPETRDGFDYRLREDLTWEEFEIPMIDPNDEEISDEEALNIIMGGAGA